MEAAAKPDSVLAASRGKFERFDVLRYPLIVMVVYVHAAGSSMAIGDSVVGAQSAASGWTLIQYVLSQIVARIAVPLFFFMSGYLFFRDGMFDRFQYTKKLRNRIRTLLIPFLFWNVATFLLVFIAQSIPATAALFNSSKATLASLSIFQNIAAIIGIDQYPISYQFWFIRDLIVLVVVSPALYLALRYGGAVVIALLFLVWMLLPPVVPPISNESIFFFCLGSYVAIKALDPFLADRYATGVFISYAALVVLDLLLRDHAIGPVVHHLCVLIGVAAALVASGIAVRHLGVRRVLLWLAPASFFVFATHEPALTIAKKIVYRLILLTDLSILVTYLVLPALIIVVTTGVYFAANRVVPRFMAIVTGGRS